MEFVTTLFGMLLLSVLLPQILIGRRCSSTKALGRMKINVEWISILGTVFVLIINRVFTNQPKSKCMLPDRNFKERLSRFFLLVAMLLITYPMGLYYNVQKSTAALRAARLPALGIKFGAIRSKIPRLSFMKLRSTIS